MDIFSFDRAIYRLSAFDFFGVSERFEDSVKLLLHTLVQRHVIDRVDKKTQLMATSLVRNREMPDIAEKAHSVTARTSASSRA